MYHETADSPHPSKIHFEGEYIEMLAFVYRVKTYGGDIRMIRNDNFLYDNTWIIFYSDLNLGF